MPTPATTPRGSRYGWIGLPTRPLLLLLALVAVAHLFFLRALPMPSLALAPNATRAFSTRTLPPPPPPTPPAPVAVTPTPPPPKPKPKPRPAPPKPAPVVDESAPAPATDSTATMGAADANATDPTAPGPLAAASAPESAASAAAAAAVAAVAAEAAQTAALEAPPQHPPKNRNVATGPVNIPGAVRIKYDVVGQAKGLNYSARSEMLWQHDGSHYSIVVKVSAFLIGSRSQTSDGDITPEGLAPTRFADNWRKELAAHFKRDKGRIIFSSNTPEAPLLSGAQDRVSILMQLAAMFAGAPDKYPPATTLSLQIVGARDAETWLFTVDGPEDLSLNNGHINAIKVRRNPRKEFDQTVEVWFAPSEHYLPVRLKITQANGDYVDQRMLEVEPN